MPLWRLIEQGARFSSHLANISNHYQLEIGGAHPRPRTSTIPPNKDIRFACNASRQLVNSKHITYGLLRASCNAPSNVNASFQALWQAVCSFVCLFVEPQNVRRLRKTANEFELPDSIFAFLHKWPVFGWLFVVVLVVSIRLYIYTYVCIYHNQADWPA